MFVFVLRTNFFVLYRMFGDHRYATDQEKQAIGRVRRQGTKAQATNIFTQDTETIFFVEFEVCKFVCCLRVFTRSR